MRLVLRPLAAAAWIMIPPSLAFIVYGAVVGESVGKLFISGIFPGLMLTGLFMAYVAAVAIVSPERNPARERFSLPAFLSGLWNFIPVGLLILLVLGAIYLGVATPTESAALGSFGAIVLALLYGKLTWKIFSESVHDTVISTGMIFLCVIGTQILSMALADLKIPAVISQFAISIGLGRGFIFVCVVILYLILGCFIDSLDDAARSPTYPLMMSWVRFPVVRGIDARADRMVTPPVLYPLFVIRGQRN
jgi:tripartite ATP-independent transporter DctM subunit